MSGCYGLIRLAEDCLKVRTNVSGPRVSSTRTAGFIRQPTAQTSGAGFAATGSRPNGLPAKL